MKISNSMIKRAIVKRMGVKGLATSTLITTANDWLSVSLSLLTKNVQNPDERKRAYQTLLKLRGNLANVLNSSAYSGILGVTVYDVKDAIFNINAITRTLSTQNYQSYISSVKMLISAISRIQYGIAQRKEKEIDTNGLIANAISKPRLPR